MTRLRQRDFAAFSRVLEALYADASAGTLSRRILQALEGVTSCDFASFSLMDVRRGHWHTHAMTAGVSDWPGVATYQHFFAEDPAASYIKRTRRTHVVKVSDFVSLREFRSLGVYREVFGLVGCDRRMGFGVQGATPVHLAATLNRKHRDFTEEERTLLNLLRPHLLQVNHQAHAQKEALLARERELARLGNVFGVGLGEIDAAARPVWLSPRATTLLAEFFPVRGHRPASEHLPEEIETRLLPALRSAEPVISLEAPTAPTRLIWQCTGPEGRGLRVRLATGEVPGRWYLLLDETNAATPVRQLVGALGLTPREAEVLHWLKEGKTNWEISAILGNTEKTVGKHLESVFRKLRVENRTAAARVAMEALL